MKIILAAVTSLDGKITRWDEPGTQAWNSLEDRQYFSDLIASSKLIIMGRATYEIAKKGMRFLPGQKRIVLTSQPEKFSSEMSNGQLEFTAETPTELTKRLDGEGYKEALLVGGEKVFQDFLGSGLVSEVWLTLEPEIFGSGKSLAGAKNLKINLGLMSSERLNDRGTLLLKYEVL